MVNVEAHAAHCRMASTIVINVNRDETYMYAEGDAFCPPKKGK